MTYFDELAALMRECGRCGAGYSDTRAGARAHARVFDHWPRPVVDEPPGDPPGGVVAEPDPDPP